MNPCSKILCFVFIILFSLSACAPQQVVVSTVPPTQEATFTPTPTRTNTPTLTYTPTLALSPTPIHTRTPRPTATEMPPNLGCLDEQIAQRAVQNYLERTGHATMKEAMEEHIQEFGINAVYVSPSIIVGSDYANFVGIVNPLMVGAEVVPYTNSSGNYELTCVTLAYPTNEGISILTTVTDVTRLSDKKWSGVLTTTSSTRNFASREDFIHWIEQNKSSDQKTEFVFSIWADQNGSPGYKPRDASEFKDRTVSGRGDGSLRWDVLGEENYLQYITDHKNEVKNEMPNPDPASMQEFVKLLIEQGLLPQQPGIILRMITVE
jgi:hypothetical protein